MSDFNDNLQEGLVDYIKETFEGKIIKEDKMARKDTGINVETTWLKLADGEWFEGIYKGYDEMEIDKFGNMKFFFEIDEKEKSFSQASKNKSFLMGISDKKIGQKLKIGRKGTGKDTKYIVTIV